MVASFAVTTAISDDVHAGGPDPYLADAKHRYEGLDYEQCLEQLGHAETTVHTPAERVEISLYDGLCSFELGKRERAESNFRRALRLDPRAHLPPFTSPKIIEVFDAVAAQVRDEQRDEPVPRPKNAPAPTVERRVSSHAPPLVSVILGGCSAVAIGAGAYLTVHANGIASDANSARFESDAYELGDRARSTMSGANVAFGVAGVTAAAALVYWLITSR